MKSKILAEMATLMPAASKADVERAFDATFGGLRAAIEGSGDARVPGFGTFRKKHRQGRAVRNPRTGETIQTSAKDVIVFKQSKAS